MSQFGDGICPGCGLATRLEVFISSAAERQCLGVALRMPREVAEVAIEYMGLFRPASGRAMQAKKALRLLGELETLVAAGYVSKPGHVDRPCKPAIWAAAITQMTGNRQGLTLPLSNHNYLCRVAYGLADQADAQAERTKETELQNPYRRPTSEPETVDFATMSDVEFARLPEKLQGKYRHLREG
ncbi:MAG: hypothetical protein OEV91_09790 [Desulfobulbaceae bacterium]|nr:hypothetical protein [Desulfobulbaceae bacterium]